MPDEKRIFPHTISFSRTAWIIVGALLLLLLLPSLFLPLGPDESVFLVSGEKILQGAIHYRDIVDIKPPLIYYIYALGALLSGGGEFGIRVFDAILQLLTCWLMIRLVRRMSGNDLAAALAPIFYLLLYIGQGYGAVGQCESYVGLFGLSILHLLFFHRTPLGFLGAGILTGVLMMTKFTLGIALPAAILVELLLMEDRWREGIKHSLWIVAGFFAFASLLPIYLLATSAMENFLLVHEYVRGYTKIESNTTATWLRNFFHYIPLHFSDNYSFVLFLTTVAGMTLALLRGRGGEMEEAEKKRREILGACTIFFFLLLLTVIIEGKFYHYHFSRIYPFGAILGSIGMVAAARWLRQARAPRGYSWMMAGVAAAALILYGPFPRFGWQSMPMALELARGSEAVDTFYDRMGPYYPRTELKDVGRYLKEHRGAEERIFAASSIGALIYHFAGYVPDFGIYHSQFYIAPFSPAELKESIRSYIIDGSPRFIVIQKNDTTFDHTGSWATSDEALRQLPGVDSVLHNGYEVVKKTGYFDVYRRK
jgi:4-amino-4-deoxy-L-arabinose transferase-like glycosyltransferase